MSLSEKDEPKSSLEKRLSIHDIDSKYTFLAAATKKILEEKDLSRVFQTVCEEACNLLEADRSLIVRAYHEDGEPQEILYSHKIPPEFVQRLMESQSNSIFVDTFEKKKVEIIPDIGKDARVFDLGIVHQMGYRTACIIPLFARQDPFGVIVIYHLDLREYSKKDERLAEAFGALVSTAIEKAQLVESLESGIKEQKSLYRVLKKITQSRNVDEIVQAVLAESERVMGTDRCGVMLSAGDANSPYLFATQGISPNYKKRVASLPKPFPIAQEYLSDRMKKEPTIVSDAFDDLVLGQIQKEEGNRTLAAFPLRTEEGNIGILFYYWTFRQDVDEHLRNLGQAFADQVAVALEKARIAQKSEERAARLEVVGQIAKAIVATLEPEDLFRTIIREIRRVIPCERYLIASFDGLVRRNWYIESDFGSSLNAPENIQGTSEWVREVYEKKHLVNIPDLLKVGDSARAKALSENGFRSVLAAPILQKGRCIAHISLASTRVTGFTSEHERFLSSISTHLGSAIQNASLYGKAEQRTLRFAHLNELSRQMGESLDLGEVLRSIAQAAMELIQGDKSRIFRFEESQEEFVLCGAYGAIPDEGVQRFQLGRGLVGNVAKAGEPLIVADIQGDNRWLNQEWSQKYDLHSYIAVPVQVHGKVDIVINCFSRKINFFDEEDQALLSAFASQAAIAIEKATMLEEAQNRVLRQEITARIAKAIGSTLEPQELLRTIGREIRQIAPCDRLAIIGADVSKKSFHGWYFDSERFNESFLLRGNDVFYDWLFQEVYEENKLVYIDDLNSSDLVWTSVLVEKGIRSLLLIPVLQGGQCIAHIGLTDTREDAFSFEQRELLSVLSGHVGAAIRNATLFKASEERATRFAILNEFSQKITENLELDEVLERITEAAVALLGGDLTQFRLRDDVSGELLVRACCGSMPKLNAQSPNEFEESIRVLNKGKFEPMVISDVQGLTTGVSLQWARDAGVQSILVYPLKIQAAIIGAIVCYSKTRNSFEHEHLDLLYTLASQASIAIQNARLHEEAKKSLEFFRSVVEDNADAIMIIDLNRTIIQWNVGATRLLGYSEDEAIGKSSEMLVPDNAHHEMDPRREAIFESGRMFSFESERIRKDGSKVTVSISISPVKNELGEPIAASIIYKDLTERKQAEKEIQIRAQQQEAVAELGRLALSGIEPATLMEEAVNLLSRSLDVEFAKVLRLLPEDNSFLLCAGVGWKEGLVGQATIGVDSSSQAGYTIHSSVPVVTENIHEETRFNAPSILLEHGVVSGMSIVIQGVDRPFGVLGVHTSQPRHFSQDNVHFLESVANALAESIKRHEAEEALRQSEERFRNLVEYAADAIFVHDFDGNIIDANQQACGILGYSREELLELNLRDIEVTFDIGQSHEKWKQLAQGKTLSVEGVHRRKDGTTFPVEVRLGKFDLNGRQLIVGHARDLRERKEAEEKLLLALGEAEAASRAKSDFLSTMSHELRSPLNAVIGFSELLLRDSEEEITHYLAPKIRDAGKYLLSMIEEILDLDRIEAGKVRLSVEPAAINDLVCEVVNSWHHRLPQGCSLSLSIDPACSVIACDATRICQILNNLIDNAVKYSPEGGAIEIATQARSDEVWVSVSDQGMGIGPEAMEVIFERFHQLESGYKRRAGGLGIGLALARELMEMQGGRIWVESEEARGSTFTFALPKLGAGEGDPSALAEGGGGAAGRDPWSGRTILIVDDVDHYHEYMKLLMKDAAHLESAYNGAEGIEAARRLRPDLILMDLRMPVMDGLDAIAHLKSDPETAPIPIVAVTAQAMAEDRDRALTAGADGVITKPVDVDQLINELARVVDVSV